MSIRTGVQGEGQDGPSWSSALSLGLSAARESTSLVHLLPQGLGLWREAPDWHFCPGRNWFAWRKIQSLEQSCLAWPEPERSLC